LTLSTGETSKVSVVCHKMSEPDVRWNDVWKTEVESVPLPRTRRDRVCVRPLSTSDDFQPQQGNLLGAEGNSLVWTFEVAVDNPMKTNAKGSPKRREEERNQPVGRRG